MSGEALASILDLCDEAENAGSHVTRLASIQAIRAAARAALAPPTAAAAADGARKCRERYERGGPRCTSCEPTP